LGHAEGDRFLRLIARSLVQEFATLPGSLVARVGGDEFAVVVVGHPLETVIASATRMVRATHQLGIGAGVACGVAAVAADPGERVATADLFRNADRAQYAAKRLGARYAVPAGPSLGPELQTRSA
jgi:diguanylate cyclase (GGDEF)-like protein